MRASARGPVSVALVIVFLIIALCIIPVSNPDIARQALNFGILMLLIIVIFSVIGFVRGSASVRI